MAQTASNMLNSTFMRETGTAKITLSQLRFIEMAETHRSERVEEIVQCPGNDDNVIDIQPERENHSSQAHS